MTHQLLAEVMSTALMIIFGVGVHCDDDHYMGIRYHCLLGCLWRRFNEPCYGFVESPSW